MAQDRLDPWQFRISEEPSPDAIPLGGLFLEVGPDIGVIRVQDCKGASVGILLGFPINLDSGTLLTFHRSHNVAYELGTDPDDFVEKVITSLAGRFIFIFNTEKYFRLYLDCCGQIPCVYDPVAKIAASTSHAMFDEDRYWERFDQELYDKLDILHEGWVPFGLTAHRGVNRVLPNHYLDLRTWAVKRHWPLSEIAVSNNPMEVVEEIVALIRVQLAALLQGHKRILQGLTAGHETRGLLACAKPVVKKMEFVTITGTDRHACDTLMARRIARDQGLQHMEIPRVLADPSQRDLFIRRGGHCVGDTNALYHPSVWPVADKFIMVGGLGGEIGRAFLWQSSDTPETLISAGRLIGRLGLPKLSIFTDRIDAWVAELPSKNAFLLLDLAYIEQRMAPWAGTQFCCDPTLIRLSPMITRRAFELMLSLPPEWKRSNRLSAEIISQSWPELDQYPYNSLGFWRDNFCKMQKVMNDPRIILKKIRKMTS